VELADVSGFTDLFCARYRAGHADIDAYAEDYAYLIFGLLELFQTTPTRVARMGDRAAASSGRAVLGRVGRRLVQHHRTRSQRARCG
jgi:uncharacterized protein YyaL (SSP411 family)